VKPRANLICDLVLIIRDSDGHMLTSATFIKVVIVLVRVQELRLFGGVCECVCKIIVIGVARTSFYQFCR
jgi:hypothetical protein